MSQKIKEGTLKTEIGEADQQNDIEKGKRIGSQLRNLEYYAQCCENGNKEAGSEFCNHLC